MTESAASKKSLTGVIKEIALCIAVMLVLLMADRTLENMYFFYLFDTGKRIIDLWISFEMHLHAWLKWIIPVCFAIWLVKKDFTVRLGLLMPILAVYGVFLVSSLISDGNISRWWNMTEMPFVMFLFLTMQCSTRRGIQRLAFSGTILYSVLLILNAAFIFFPQLYIIISGYSLDYFLAPDNHTGFPMFFGALMAVLDGRYNSTKRRMIVYFVLFYLNMALIRCASALLGCVIFTAYLVIPGIRRAAGKWNFNFFTLLSMLICAILVTVSRLFFSNESFASLVGKLFTLKESLYIRIILWSGVFLEVLAKPVFGYGLGDSAVFFMRPETDLKYNAHNAWLQTLHEGGIVTAASVFFVLAMFAKKLRSFNDRNLSGLFAVIAFIDLVMMQFGITAWFTWAPLFMVVQTASLSDILEE